MVASRGGGVCAPFAPPPPPPGSDTVLGRKQNHTDSLCRKPFFVDGSLGRKQAIMQSRRKPNLTDSLRRKRKLTRLYPVSKKH